MTDKRRVGGSIGPSIADERPLSIQQNANGQYTKTIRGNCTQQLDVGLPLLPPAEPHQCVITVLQSFLDVALDDSLVWLSDLYIRLSGQPRDPDAVITARGRALYMTNMTLSGDGSTARAIHVMPRSNLFVSGSNITLFKHETSAALRLESGARATIHRTTFSNNRAEVGPVAGLRSTTSSAADRIGAVVWFNECSFRRNSANDSSGGLVDVEDTRCYIYSDQRGKAMWRQFCGWDIENNVAHRCRAYELVPQQPSHWQAVGAKGGGATFVRDHGVFSHVAAAAQPLSRSTDAGFRQSSAEQAARSGLAAPHLILLPAGADLISKQHSVHWTGILLLSLSGAFFCICFAGVWVLIVRSKMKQQKSKRKDDRGTAPLSGNGAHGPEACGGAMCSEGMGTADPCGMPSAVAVNVNKVGAHHDFERCGDSMSATNCKVHNLSCADADPGAPAGAGVASAIQLASTDECNCGKLESSGNVSSTCRISFAWQQVPPPLLETEEDTVDSQLAAKDEAGVRVLTRFKVNKKYSVAVFKATTNEDMKDIVKLLPDNTALPASNKMKYVIARLELHPAISIKERLVLVNEQSASMADAVGPAVGCLMATFGTNMISSCVYDFDDPVELEGFAEQKRIELWGLQIPQNAMRPGLKDADPEALPDVGGKVEEQAAAWSPVDRLNMSVGLLYALCVHAHDFDVSCGFCTPRLQFLKRLQGAGVHMKEVTTKMRLIYPPHAQDYEYYKASTVAYFLVDEVRDGLREKVTLLE